MSIIQDVASEILKHVKHPDDGYKIWEISAHTSTYNPYDLEEHKFQLRIRNRGVDGGIADMSLVSLRTGMRLNLSDVKGNVELTCCSNLNMKSGPMMKRISTFLQLHLDSNVLKKAPTFNGKVMREHALPGEDDALSENERVSKKYHIYRVYYAEFVEDILKYCVGHKLGYFDQPKKYVR